MIESFINQDEIDDGLGKSPEDTDHEHEEAVSRHRSREKPTVEASRIQSREAALPKAIVDISVIKITT
jgi:hypothetical protein